MIFNSRFFHKIFVGLDTFYDYVVLFFDDPVPKLNLLWDFFNSVNRYAWPRKEIWLSIGLTHVDFTCEKHAACNHSGNSVLICLLLMITESDGWDLIFKLYGTLFDLTSHVFRLVYHIHYALPFYVYQERQSPANWHFLSVYICFFGVVSSRGILLYIGGWIGGVMKLFA